MDEQRQLILDQFTRQAAPFSEVHRRHDAGIQRLLIDTADIGPEDEVLDVACGPGLVACEVAKLARHVTGVDLTPAMIEEAEARQRWLTETRRTPVPCNALSWPACSLVWRTCGASST